MPTYFRHGLRGDWYAVNAMELSKFCLARGRYEIAQELHLIGTDWYDRMVVQRPNPGDTREDRKANRELLASYREYASEFPKLIEARERLLAAVSDHPAGIDRNEFKNSVKHSGVTTFGVICNQLTRGGWLRQEKTGSKYLLYPESTPPKSDEAFVNEEMPTPDKSGSDSPARQSGFLGRIGRDLRKLHSRPLEPLR